MHPVGVTEDPETITLWAAESLAYTGPPVNLYYSPSKAGFFRKVFRCLMSPDRSNPTNPALSDIPF